MAFLGKPCSLTAACDIGSAVWVHYEGAGAGPEWVRAAPLERNVPRGL